MKWKKLGQIFNPLEHDLPLRCREFAQAPQALVLQDRVRIYFSSRERDASGKYLSHVLFADFALDLKSVLAVSEQPVIELGGLGCFDEHGIFPVHILSDGDQVLAYTTGWNRKVSVSADASIGLAVSCDGGLTFEKLGQGPVMTACLQEPFLVGDPYVLKHEGVYHMYYIFGSRWIESGETPERVYKIARATSQDGINWVRDSRPIVADVLNADECQALPTVFAWGGKWHMYFCFREAVGFRQQTGRGYRLGYAFSSDLIHWERDDASSGIALSESGWDSQMQCYPSTFRLGESLYMLYNGNEFGRLGFGLAALCEGKGDQG